MNENPGDQRDPNGDLLSPAHGAVSLDARASFIDRAASALCRDRQAQIEAGSILVEDLRACGLTRGESRVLGLLSAGWTLREAAGIMRVSPSTAKRAARSMRGKVRPALSAL